MNRDILKGQCLNLVFGAMFSGELDVEHSANRDRAIRLSHKLFEESLAANFEGW